MVGCGEEVMWDDMMFGEGQSCECGKEHCGVLILCIECGDKE